MLQAEQDALVLLAQRGNNKALEMLFRHISPGMSRYAYRLCGDPELAQEVVQDVWVKSLKTLRRLQDPRAFKSWIFRAVKWQALDALRKVTAREKVEDLEQHADIEAEDIAQCEASTELLDLIAGLPQPERQVVYLFYQEDMQLSEIAIIEEVPVGTVKSRLNRAREKLRQKLENQDEFR